MDPRLLEQWERALIDEGVKGTVLEQIARKTKGFESGGNPNAVSNRGATGWMQVMPATFGDVADQGWDINNPYHNARAGIRYLKKGWEASGGDPALTGAYYYGGPGGMEKARQGVAVSDPKNPNYPNTIQYGSRLAKAIEGLFPAAHAGELPKDKGTAMQNPMQTPPPGVPPVNVNVTNSTMLPNTMAALLGRYPGLINPGGEFRSQNAAAIAPEAIQSLQDAREVKARMLPVAMGALMSSNSGANQFGQAMIGPAMSSIEPTKMQNGLITPDGQYITDVDSSALMKNLAGLSKGDAGAKLPAGEITKFGAELSDFSQFSHLSNVFNPSFTGRTPFETLGNAENWVGKKFDMGLKDQAEFWMGYQGLINKVRNREFGSALTETERAEFEKAIVRPGMDPGVIKSYLDRQKSLLQSALERQSLMFRESGYNTRGLDMGISTVKGNGQVTNTSDMNNAPKPGGKKLSDEELDKLYGG